MLSWQVIGIAMALPGNAKAMSWHSHSIAMATTRHCHRDDMAMPWQCHSKSQSIPQYNAVQDSIRLKCSAAPCCNVVCQVSSILGNPLHWSAIAKPWHHDGITNSILTILTILVLNATCGCLMQPGVTWRNHRRSEILNRPASDGYITSKNPIVQALFRE